MKHFLIIPKLDDIEKSAGLARQYNLGYEYNDFFIPALLDSDDKVNEIISAYKGSQLPEYCTMHGAFFDVIVFSPDSRICEISDMRVKQSIAAAKKIGAKAVVFHTNYNPFLNSEKYVDDWIKANRKYWSDVLCANRDINIYLENMFDSSPEIMARLSSYLCEYENYGICLDYAHAALTQVSLESWVKALHKYIRHIHINDNNLISDGHLAIGDGKIDFSEFYELYNQYMDGATILIETSSVENQEKSIQKLISDGFMKVEI